ncbi:hypothetical protein SteCoe_16769 [Stentor coeruleus]|uniref:Uncharacterized protein n=1 Tax=Stentor coeruleus TaxID=5963 RepID=A0A1R2C0N4_9CILI|nr:hypothetical protein SteCoe_16769 [Stentor coeruleus]
MVLALVIICLNLALGCDKFCASLCERSNGKDKCFASCNCQKKQTNELTDLVLKTDYKDYIRNKFECYIEDVYECEELPTEDEYYYCLYYRDCLEAIDITHLFSSLPLNLIPAIEPSYIRLSWPIYPLLSSCNECFYSPKLLEFSSQNLEEYYSCVYVNCKSEILNDFSKQLLGSSKQNICYDCGEYLNTNDDINCIWFNCRYEIVQKNELFKDFYLEELKSQYNLQSCDDCDSLVYADEYYNCIKNYCKDDDEGKFENFNMDKLQECLNCEYVENTQWNECYNSKCKLDSVKNFLSSDTQNANESINKSTLYAGLSLFIVLIAIGFSINNRTKLDSKGFYSRIS